MRSRLRIVALVLAMPTTTWELTDPEWRGSFMITRGGNGSMVAHVAALRAAWGDEKTVEWLSAVKSNAGAVVNGHGDIRRVVGAGEFRFGLVNKYYYHHSCVNPKITTSASSTWTRARMTWAPSSTRPESR